MSSEKNPTRTRILKASWKLLEEGGGADVRMSDIAKAAGISRQALYLHFPTRAELLVETTRYLDEFYDIQGQLAATRAAVTGRDRLREWVAVWGDYIPKVYGISKALLAMKDSDAEVAAAWQDRMQAVREGCAAAVAALRRDAILSPDLSETQATDLLWTLLSVRTWEHLRQECGWSQESYLAEMQRAATRLLIVT